MNTTTSTSQPPQAQQAQPAQAQVTQPAQQAVQPASLNHRKVIDRRFKKVYVRAVQQNWRVIAVSKNRDAVLMNHLLVPDRFEVPLENGRAKDLPHHVIQQYIARIDKVIATTARNHPVRRGDPMRP